MPFFVGLEGTEVTTKTQLECGLAAKTWIIIEKLEEASIFITKEKIDGACKPETAAVKLFCYMKGDTDKKQAFMRIY